ncbi:HvfC/BufC family peptide modification chaperone [Parasphingorhabdus sp. DH2-15]|uniref:HvfC/BufC family peptide modification chaperone n=1 Tax=Parasphingorhabdus sp. DH2-15 TaxID=3444112 RepID=UPI003F68549F
MDDKDLINQQSLDSFQRWFQQMVISSSHDDQAIDSAINAPPHGSVQDRLAIYQSSYRRRLATCLTEQYPALTHALGEALFHDFAMDYLMACPSESYTLYDLGDRFPMHLEQERPDAHKPSDEREVWIDFIVELARFERTIFAMFDAHSAPNIATNTEFTGITPNLFEQWQLHPDLIIFASQFPVADYYHAVKMDKHPGLPPVLPSHVALLRRDYQTRINKLTPRDYWFLSNWSAFADGAPNPLDEKESEALIRKLVQDGFIVCTALK